MKTTTTRGRLLLTDRSRDTVFVHPYWGSASAFYWGSEGIYFGLHTFLCVRACVRVSESADWRPSAESPSSSLRNILVSRDEC